MLQTSSSNAKGVAVHHFRAAKSRLAHRLHVLVHIVHERTGTGSGEILIQHLTLNKRADLSKRRGKSQTKIHGLATFSLPDQQKPGKAMRVVWDVARKRRRFSTAF